MSDLEQYRQEIDELEAEGVEFKSNGCVDMAKYQWQLR